MSETIVPSSSVKHKGTLDLRRMYQSLWGWLEAEGYKIQEKQYGERVKPEGKTYEINWEATRTEEDYFTYTITVSLYITGLQKVETEHNGERMTLDSATYEIKLSGTLARNVTNEWNEGSFMFRFYEGRVIPDRIEAHRIEMYENVMSLLSEVKTFLHVYQF